MREAGSRSLVRFGFSVALDLESAFSLEAPLSAGQAAKSANNSPLSPSLNRL